MLAQPELPAHAPPMGAMGVFTQVPFWQVSPALQVPQVNIAPQPFAIWPHVAPAAAHVVGTQAQSLSFADVQPGAQQPSELWHAVIGWLMQTTLQRLGEPETLSTVQALLSSHEVGQLPSQTSPATTTPSPHEFEQSLSVSSSHAVGQQPSSFLQPVIRLERHSRLQFWAEPDATSVRHASVDSQLSQLPSQVSPVSTTPSPHVIEQSLSESESQAAGQHPSSSTQVSTIETAQVAEQASALPWSVAMEHADALVHSVGHAPSPVAMAASQASLEDTTPSPQVTTTGWVLPPFSTGLPQPTVTNKINNI
jgi:hypothetical protein